MISYAKTDTGIVRDPIRISCLHRISRWDRSRTCSSLQTEWADIKQGISHPGMSWNI